MIYFNGIELDYNENTLNKIVVKKSLTDIESLGNRRGTSSTTFDVPRTAHNERAFGLMTFEGGLFNPIGTGELHLNGNPYVKGTIKVKGYNDTIFKLLFIGSDIDTINTLKETPLKDLLNPALTGGTGIYSDAFIKNAFGNITTTSQLDYIYDIPQAHALYDASIVVPFFSASRIINKIKGSDFMTTDYASYLYYSNFVSTHYSTTLTADITHNFTTSLNSAISLGAVTSGNSVTLTGNNYYFVDDVTKLKADFKVNIVEDEAIELVTVNLNVWEGGLLIVTGQSANLSVGYNDISLKSDTAISSGSYIVANVSIILKAGYSLPINFDVNISGVNIQTDNIQENAVVLLSDYLGDLSQLDFLQNYLKFHNLVMDIEDETVYIDCQTDATIIIEPVNGLAINQKDITDKIESSTDISLDYSLNKYIYFEQGMITSENQTVKSLNEVSTTGSVFTDLNVYGDGIEVYKVGFNSVYDGLDGYQLSDTTTLQVSNVLGIPNLFDVNKHITAPNGKIPIGYALQWENYLTILSGVFSGYGSTSIVDYTNLDGTATTTAKIKIQNQLARYGSTGIIGTFQLFKGTLEQKKNNKVREIELYDYSGTLINFRTDYIINKQIYKLLSYEFEPISKRIKAKIILK